MNPKQIRDEKFKFGFWVKSNDSGNNKNIINLGNNDNNQNNNND